MWRHWRQFLCFCLKFFDSQTACFATWLASLQAVSASLASAILPPSFRAFQALNRAHFPCKASSTFSFHHQVSCLHLWFLERPQTLVAASCRGPFSFDQTVSTRFAASPATPALIAATAEAVVTFNLKAGWNWLAVIGSLTFQAQMLGKNLHFVTRGVCAMKSHTTIWCYLTNSSLGKTFTLMTVLLKLLGQIMKIWIPCIVGIWIMIAQIIDRLLPWDFLLRHQMILIQ